MKKNLGWQSTPTLEDCSKMEIEISKDMTVKPITEGLSHKHVHKRQNFTR